MKFKEGDKVIIIDTYLRGDQHAIGKVAVVLGYFSSSDTEFSYNYKVRLTTDTTGDFVYANVREPLEMELALEGL
jgi:hypothetical protein